MSSFTLADGYKAAGVSGGHEILTLRQAPFDDLKGKIDAARAVDLTRLYFGLSSVGDLEWFRKPFSDADAGFSMIENEREAAILAAALLGAALERDVMAAGLAPLAAEAAGLRTPLVRPELLVEARRELTEKAVAARKRAALSTEGIKGPYKTKLAAEVDALRQTADIAKAADAIAQASADAAEATKTLAAQVTAVVKPMARQIADLVEETEILWWHIGGSSRVLDRPFAGLKPGLAALLAGLDVADLSRTLLGPASAPALLQRTITVPRRSPGPIAISEVAEAWLDEKNRDLEFQARLNDVADLCPVLTAVAKAQEIGAGSAWHGAFGKATGLAPSDTFKPLELAMQVFRERQLLYALD